MVLHNTKDCVMQCRDGYGDCYGSGFHFSEWVGPFGCDGEYYAGRKMQQEMNLAIRRYFQFHILPHFFRVRYFFFKVWSFCSDLFLRASPVLFRVFSSILTNTCSIFLGLVHKKMDISIIVWKLMASFAAGKVAL